MLQLTVDEIALGKQATTKQQAITQIAGDLIEKGFVTSGYEIGMLERESQQSTFLGNGIAIPHGTTSTRDLVNQTGVKVHHFAEGVDWGEGNIAYLVIGIAAKSDEHLSILKQLTAVLGANELEEQLKKVTQANDILCLLNGPYQKGLLFTPALVTLQFPVMDLLSLCAVAASKLTQANAINPDSAKALINAKFVHVGQGLWVISTHIAVKQTSVAFITPQNPFVHQNNEVSALLVIAAMDADYFAILTNLVNLLTNNQLTALYSADAPAVIKALTEVREQGLTEVFTIRNPHGLHARPGATLVNVVKKFESKIVVSNLNGDAKQVNAKSLMKVIALGVKQGHQLEFVADGEDAEFALRAIGEAIASGLGEDLV